MPSAPELRVPHWIDGNGKDRPPLKLAELGGGFKVIFAFKAMCPGCHSSAVSYTHLTLPTICSV